MLTWLFGDDRLAEPGETHQKFGERLEKEFYSFVGDLMIKCQPEKEQKDGTMFGISNFNGEKEKVWKNLDTCLYKMRFNESKKLKPTKRKKFRVIVGSGGKKEEQPNDKRQQEKAIKSSESQQQKNPIKSSELVPGVESKFCGYLSLQEAEEWVKWIETSQKAVNYISVCVELFEKRVVEDCDTPIIHLRDGCEF